MRGFETNLANQGGALLATALSSDYCRGGGIETDGR
jgi:hypothetical protein